MGVWERWEGGDVFGVVVAPLQPPSSLWPRERPVQLQVTPWPKADAAFELETSWPCSETLYDTWMKSSHHTNFEKNPLQGNCGILEAVAFFFFNSSEVAVYCSLVTE